jgi:hypothetical protein
MYGERNTLTDLLWLGRQVETTEVAKQDRRQRRARFVLCHAAQGRQFLVQLILKRRARSSFCDVENSVVLSREPMYASAIPVSVLDCYSRHARHLVRQPTTARLETMQNLFRQVYLF